MYVNQLELRTGRKWDCHEPWLQGFGLLGFLLPWLSVLGCGATRTSPVLVLSIDAIGTLDGKAAPGGSML